MGFDEARQALVQFVDVRQPAAEHEGVGIDDVGDHRQAAAQPVEIAIEADHRLGVAGPGGGDDRLAGQGLAGAFGMVAAEAGAGNPGLQAAMTAAPAGRARRFLRLGPGQGRVAPFAGHAVGALDELAVDRQAAAATGADDHREDPGQACRRTVDGLGQGQAVGVVGQPHGTTQARLQVLAEPPAVQPSGIGVAHHARARRHRARRAHADRAAAAGLLLGLGDQVADRDDGRVVGSRLGGPHASQEPAVRRQGGGLDLRAAKINADLHQTVFPPAAVGRPSGLARRAHAVCLIVSSPE